MALGEGGGLVGTLEGDCPDSAADAGKARPSTAVSAAAATQRAIVR